MGGDDRQSWKPSQKADAKITKSLISRMWVVFWRYREMEPSWRSGFEGSLDVERGGVSAEDCGRGVA